MFQPNKGGRPKSLRQQDISKVATLLTQYQNKTLVSELLGVSTHTLLRFEKAYLNVECKWTPKQDFIDAEFVDESQQS
jgi:hypothetical protein